MLWLVGAGTGDPDTLTVRAAELLASASHVLAEVALWPLVRQLGADAALREPGPVSTWPDAGPSSQDQGSIVRLYLGDGIEASATERAALSAIGRHFDVVAGVAPRSADDALAAQRPQQRPLRGLSVVVTRPEAQQASLSAALRRLGATVVALPTIAIAAPADGGAALRAALEQLDRYRWVVLTSANGARALLAELDDLRRAAGVKVAAIGPATARVLADARLPADLVPEQFVAEGLLDVFPRPPADGGSDRVLLVRAEVARDTLPDGLRSAGWQLDVVAAYRTVAAAPPAALDGYLRRRLDEADVVVFSSPSTVEHFVASYGRERLGRGPLGDPAGLAVIAIGPVTAAAAQRLGVAVDLVAERYDAEGLLAAVRRWAATAR